MNMLNVKWTELQVYWPKDKTYSTSYENVLFVLYHLVYII